MTHWHPHDYAGMTATVILILIAVAFAAFVCSVVMRRPRKDPE